jgi:hypothetical protein
VGEHPTIMGRGRVVSKVMCCAVAGLLLCCGGHESLNVCDCTPSAPDSEDYRHNAKHVPLPNTPAQEITVATMLTWAQTPVPASVAPRAGRELQMFHIAHAFVQLTYEVGSDCDIHMEISDTPDKTAPRVIVETPIDPEYCPSRQAFQAGMAAHDFQISILFTAGEVPHPVAVDVLGLAFQDEPHAGRGSVLVQSIWEIHPAIVTVQ